MVGSGPDAQFIIIISSSIVVVVVVVFAVIVVEVVVAVVGWLVGWLVGFYGVSTFVGYLTPNSVYMYFFDLFLKV